MKNIYIFLEVKMKFVRIINVIILYILNYQHILKIYMMKKLNFNLKIHQIMN